MPTFLLCSSKHSVTEILFMSKFISLILGDMKVKRGLITLTKSSIPLNTLPFHSCNEPSMPTEGSRSGCYEAHDSYKWKIFKKQGYQQPTT